MADLRIEPCNLHEITNCSTCTGLDKKLAKEAEQFRPPTTFTMLSRWSGVCSKCGEHFPSGAEISQSGDGWICCP